MVELRRYFDLKQKKELIQKYRTGEISKNELKKKYNLIPQDITRFEKILNKNLSKLNGHQVRQEVSQEIINASRDERDLMIMRLKMKVSDLVLEIEQLKAQLNGNKRYSDKQLYADQRNESHKVTP